MDLKQLNDTKRRSSVFMTAVTMLTAMCLQLPVYCDAFDSAITATNALKDRVVELAKVLLPFSLIVLIVLILFTHDQKALQMELKTALILCVAYIFLLIIDSDAFMETFDNLGISYISIKTMVPLRM